MKRFISNTPLGSGWALSGRGAALALALGPLLLAGPAAQDAAAQVCMGSPAAQGQATVHATVGLNDRYREYAGDVHRNRDGSLGLWAGLSRKSASSIAARNVTSASLGLGYEMGGNRLGACAIVQPHLARGSQSINTHQHQLGTNPQREVREHRIAAEAGVALGARWNVGDATAILPWARAALYPYRARYRVRHPGGAEQTGSGRETELLADLGITWAHGPWSVRTSMSWDPVDVAGRWTLELGLGMTW